MKEESKKIVYFCLITFVFFLGFDMGRGKSFRRFQPILRKNEDDSLPIDVHPRLKARFAENIFPQKDYPVIENKEFVIVITSYNNEKWVQKNLESLLEQSYDHYHVIYIDDSSDDQTFFLAKNLIENSKLKNRTTLIRNEKRCLAMHNLFHAIHSCKNYEIIVSLDGDDWFAHSEVLTRLNQIYQNPDVWLTYGQNIVYPKYNEIQCSPFDKEFLKEFGYRNHPWVTAQLRTFYSGLFKKIDYKDLMMGDGFLEAGCDLGYMFPILEMSAGRYRFIDEVLYIYNQDHPFNDHKIHKEKLMATWNYVKSLPPYAPLDRPPYEKY